MPNPKDLKTKQEVIAHNCAFLKKQLSSTLMRSTMNEEAETRLDWFCYPNAAIIGVGYIQHQDQAIREEINKDKIYSISVYTNDIGRVLDIEFDSVALKDQEWVKNCLEATKEKYHQSLNL